MRKRDPIATLIIAGAVLSSGLASATEAPQHTQVPASAWQAVTLERTDAQLDAAAARGKGEAYARVALVHISYPQDADEYAQLGGCAFVLVTAVSQDKTELPVARAYIEVSGREIPLALVVRHLTDRTGSSAPSVVAFGPFRDDALFLVPVTTRLEGGIFMVDFAKGQSRVKLADFSIPLPPEVGRFVKTVKSPKVDGAGVRAFLAREYPGFFDGPEKQQSTWPTPGGASAGKASNSAMQPAAAGAPAADR